MGKVKGAVIDEQWEYMIEHEVDKMRIAYIKLPSAV